MRVLKILGRVLMLIPLLIIFIVHAVWVLIDLIRGSECPKCSTRNKRFIGIYNDNKMIYMCKKCSNLIIK